MWKSEKEKIIQVKVFEESSPGSEPYPKHEMLTIATRWALGQWDDGTMTPALLTLIPRNKFLGNVARHHPKMY